MKLKKIIYSGTSGIVARLFSQLRDGTVKNKPTGNAVPSAVTDLPAEAAAAITDNAFETPGAVEPEDAYVDAGVPSYICSCADAPQMQEALYGENGLDCAGYSRAFYRTAIEHLLDRICRAARQMHSGNYEFALFDVRFVEDSALKMLLRHHGLTPGKLELNINLCHERGLIPTEMVPRLHGVRSIGNFNQHDDFAPRNFTFKQVYFCVMQVLDLLEHVEKHLLWPEALLELTEEWEKNPILIDEIINNGSTGETTVS